MKIGFCGSFFKLLVKNFIKLVMYNFEIVIGKNIKKKI